MKFLPHLKGEDLMGKLIENLDELKPQEIKKENIEQKVSSFEDIPNPNDYVGSENIEEKLSNPVENDPQILSKEKAPYVKNQIDARYQSIYLPSMFKFYDFKTIMVRTFEIRDLSKMYSCLQSESYKLFKEVIQGCVDVDVDLLTPGDFKYLCYWLRTNSYTKTPIRVEWMSKYGNKCISEVTKANITTLELDTDMKVLEPWIKKGFTVPTMKFADIFQDGQLSESDDFMYSNAQYFQGNTWEEKIQTMEKYLNENGLEALADVEEWDKLTEHGVEEQMKVYNLNFDVQKYKELLESRIRKAKILLNNLQDKEGEDYLVVSSGLVTTQKELEDLNKKLEKGEEIRPEPETLFLEMGPYELLSPLLAKRHN